MEDLIPRVGAINFAAELRRSLASPYPSHDQHKEGYASKREHVRLDCVPEGVPTGEHSGRVGIQPDASMAAR
jgi:hypothetical protein